MIQKTVKSFILALIIMPLAITACANDGHNIEVKVHGVSDTLSYLAYHYGDRQYLRDTVEVDSAGNFAFSGNKKLPQGMYLIVLPGQKYFEVIINEDQHFEIETVMDNFVEMMQITGSPENSSFYDYLRYIRTMNEKVAPTREKLQDMSISEERRESLREESSRIDKKVEQKQEEHIEKFPDCVFTIILKAQKSIPRPQPVVKEDGSTDHMEAYNKFKNSFWQHIDLTDERILNTPIYHSKLREYFESVIIQHPDTLVKEADRIISKTEENENMFRYTVSRLTNHFERSNIMGIDAAFVHVVNEYYKTGKVFWMEEDRLNRIIERAEQLEPILIGKVAPDIEMHGPDLSKVSLHDVEAELTILYFWDMDCPHCKKLTPKIKDIHQKYADDGIEVFAVNTDVDSERWVKYINENELGGFVNVIDPANQSQFRDKYDIYSIPIVFLLDEEKRILAKRLNAEQLDDFITRKIRER